MCKVEMNTTTVQNGDSGGVVYQGTGNVTFCGVIHGHSYGLTKAYAYFTPYQYMYNKGFVVNCDN